jgi:branched-chain amino acid transport system permease protein
MRRAGGPHRGLTRDYADELKLWRTRSAKAWAAALAVLWLLTPMLLTDPFWLSVLNYAGIAAIGAIGLNLLTGYTGQVSLGHAFFIGAGAYVAAAVGGELGLPLVLWLPAAALLGAAVGALVGPFALRLRGNYLAIVTLGLVFLGEHLFRNLESVTGGNSGTSVSAPATLGPLDFNALVLLGDEFLREQGWFWLVWGLVAVCALLVKNVVRTRPGRALQAIRDRDVAAEVVGVELGRYKVAAFAASSALAALGGATYCW